MGEYQWSSQVKNNHRVYKLVGAEAFLQMNDDGLWSICSSLTEEECWLVNQAPSTLPLELSWKYLNTGEEDKSLQAVQCNASQNFQSNHEFLHLTSISSGDLKEVPEEMKIVLTEKDCTSLPSKVDEAQKKPLVDIFLNPSEDSKKRKDSTVKTQQKKAKEYFSAVSMSELIPKLFRLLWYSSLPCSPLPRLSNNSLIKSCKLFGDDVNCSQIFQKVTTDMGLCCAFNSQNALRDSNYSKLMDEMRKSTEFSAEDKRVTLEGPHKTQAGKSNGLRLVLDLHSNDVSFGSLFEDFKAFRILIGQPAEFPFVREFGQLLEPGHEYFLALSTQVINASGIEILSPKTRNCYFADEKNLEFYKTYSFRNCHFECSINQVKSELGCIPWYLPSTDHSRVCDPWEGIEFMHRLRTNSKQKGGCKDCLPDCKEVKTSVTTTAAKIRYHRVMKRSS